MYALTTIQCIAYTGKKGHGKQCLGYDENGKYYAQSGNQTHISCIPVPCANHTPPSLTDVTILPTPTYIYGSQREKRVHTTAKHKLENLLKTYISYLLFYRRPNQSVPCNDNHKYRFVLAADLVDYLVDILIQWLYQDVYNTLYFRFVTYLGTDKAQRCLILVIR